MTAAHCCSLPLSGRRKASSALAICSLLLAREFEIPSATIAAMNPPMTTNPKMALPVDCD
jgi:hypothetical protein